MIYHNIIPILIFIEVSNNPFHFNKTIDHLGNKRPTSSYEEQRRKTLGKNRHRTDTEIREALRKEIL